MAVKEKCFESLEFFLNISLFPNTQLYGFVDTTWISGQQIFEVMHIFIHGG